MLIVRFFIILKFHAHPILISWPWNFNFTAMKIQMHGHEILPFCNGLYYSELQNATF